MFKHLSISISQLFCRLWSQHALSTDWKWTSYELPEKFTSRGISGEQAHLSPSFATARLCILGPGTQPLWAPVPHLSVGWRTQQDNEQSPVRARPRVIAPWTRAREDQVQRTGISTAWWRNKRLWEVAAKLMNRFSKPPVSVLQDAKSLGEGWWWWLWQMRVDLRPLNCVLNATEPFLWWGQCYECFTASKK